MAAKNKIVYICSNCGFESAKWAGKCPDCGEWNTMEESVKTAISAKSAASGVYFFSFYAADAPACNFRDRYGGRASLSHRTFGA